MKPYIIDLIVLVIILFEFLMGLRRGLSGELFRLFGTCLVLAVGLGFYEDFGLMIAHHSRLTQNQEIATALAFLLIVTAGGVCFFLLRIVFTLMVNVKFNDAFDRPAGGVTGILRGCLLAVLLLFAAGLWPNEELRPLITVNSHAGRVVFSFAPLIKEKIRALPDIRSSPGNAGDRESDELHKDAPRRGRPKKQAPESQGRDASQRHSTSDGSGLFCRSKAPGCAGWKSRSCHFEIPIHEL